MNPTCVHPRGCPFIRGLAVWMSVASTSLLLACKKPSDSGTILKANELLNRRASEAQVIGELGAPLLKTTNRVGVIYNYDFDPSLKERWKGKGVGGVQILFVDGQIAEVQPVLTFR